MVSRRSVVESSTEHIETFASPFYARVVDHREQTIETFSICDDCHEAYFDPPYYVWDEDACTVTETDPKTGITTEIPHECTFNLCPDCAGPYLEPDDEDDPRRPTA